MATDVRASRFHEKPVVVGVFVTIAEAQHAVGELLLAGFAKPQITVVCSDPQKEAHFREFERQEPAGYYTPQAIATGAIAGALVGFLMALVVLANFGQLEGFVSGLLFVPFGLIAGGFLGAMLTRNAEKELSNFYDQGVEPGSIVVAAEDHSEQADKTLLLAEKIMSREGVRPLDLPEG
jgi:hypothetical protein